MYASVEEHLHRELSARLVSVRRIIRATSGTLVSSLNLAVSVGSAAK